MIYQDDSAEFMKLPRVLTSGAFYLQANRADHSDPLEEGEIEVSKSCTMFVIFPRAEGDLHEASDPDRFPVRLGKDDWNPVRIVTGRLSSGGGKFMIRSKRIGPGSVTFPHTGSPRVYVFK